MNEYLEKHLGSAWYLGSTLFNKCSLSARNVPNPGLCCWDIIVNKIDKKHLPHRVCIVSYILVIAIIILK